MNLNLDLKVDKAVNKISESKTLRIWTYIIACFVVFGLIVWQTAPILNAIATLVEVLK